MALGPGLVLADVAGSVFCPLTLSRRLLIVCGPDAPGHSITALSLKNNGGGHLRGRPSLVGRAMIVTDHADALFFRAVGGDRHHTHACTVFRTLRARESAPV
jgi:hypothetical protein